MAYSARIKKDGAVDITDALTGQIKFTISAKSAGIGGVSISGDTATIMLKDGTTQVYDLKKRQQIR
jgi:WD40 repeat protein